jgi:hypothetical protein
LPGPILFLFEFSFLNVGLCLTKTSFDIMVSEHDRKQWLLYI